MSLSDRAAHSVKVERTAVNGSRTGLLGQVEGVRASPPRVVHLPSTWTAIHVLDRMEEAFQVLARMPMSTRPKAFGNTLPEYVYDRFDLNAQQEGGELERSMRQRNRVVIPPTPAEIGRMQEAIHWPSRFLSDKPEVARAVCMGALWAVQRADIVKRCAGIGIPEHRIRWFLKRKMHGLNVIAIGLARARVPVS